MKKHAPGCRCCDCTTGGITVIVSACVRQNPVGGNTTDPTPPLTGTATAVVGGQAIVRAGVQTLANRIVFAPGFPAGATVTVKVSVAGAQSQGPYAPGGPIPPPIYGEWTGTVSTTQKCQSVTLFASLPIAKLPVLLSAIGCCDGREVSASGSVYKVPYSTAGASVTVGPYSAALDSYGKALIWVDLNGGSATHAATCVASNYVTSTQSVTFTQSYCYGSVSFGFGPADVVAGKVPFVGVDPSQPTKFRGLPASLTVTDLLDGQSFACAFQYTTPGANYTTTHTYQSPVDKDEVGHDRVAVVTAVLTFDCNGGDGFSGISGYAQRYQDGLGFTASGRSTSDTVYIAARPFVPPPSVAAPRLLIVE